MRLLFLSESTASFYTMPLREASTTTCRGRVLSYKDRVPFERRLLAIVSRGRGCKTLCYEVSGVSENGGKAFFLKIGFLFLTEPEALAEG